MDSPCIFYCPINRPSSTFRAVPKAARVSRISAILARGARVKDLAMVSAVAGDGEAVRMARTAWTCSGMVAG